MSCDVVPVAMMNSVAIIYAMTQLGVHLPRAYTADGAGEANKLLHSQRYSSTLLLGCRLDSRPTTPTRDSAVVSSSNGLIAISYAYQSQVLAQIIALRVRDTPIDVVNSALEPGRLLV